MAQADVRPPDAGEPRFRVLGAIQVLGAPGPIELAGDRRRALLAALLRVLRDSADPDVAADYLEATYTADVRRHLPDVRCPALVLHYRDDKVIPFAGGEQLAAGLPDVRFVALDGGFHLPDVQDLDPIVDAVTRFAGHATSVRHDVEEGSSA